MKDNKDYEVEIFAAVGKLIVSNLQGHDDLARAIFDALVPEFENRYPRHKILAELVLRHVPERDETKEEIIARLQGRGKPRPYSTLPEVFRVRLDGLATVVTTQADPLPAMGAADHHEREDWQQYSAAMRTIATAFGTTVYCHQKNNRIAVDFQSVGLSQEQLAALAVIENLVELVSEFPAGYLEKLEPPK